MRREVKLYSYFFVELYRSSQNVDRTWTGSRHPSPQWARQEIPSEDETSAYAVITSGTTKTTMISERDTPASLPETKDETKKEEPPSALWRIVLISGGTAGLLRVRVTCILYLLSVPSLFPVAVSPLIAALCHCRRCLFRARHCDWFFVVLIDKCRNLIGRGAIMSCS